LDSLNEVLPEIDVSWARRGPAGTRPGSAAARRRATPVSWSVVVMMQREQGPDRAEDSTSPMRIFFQESSSKGRAAGEDQVRSGSGPSGRSGCRPASSIRRFRSSTEASLDHEEGQESPKPMQVARGAPRLLVTGSHVKAAPTRTSRHGPPRTPESHAAAASPQSSACRPVAFPDLHREERGAGVGEARRTRVVVEPGGSAASAWRRRSNAPTRAMRRDRALGQEESLGLDDEEAAVAHGPARRPRRPSRPPPRAAI
jgi:hypothetical protein